MSRKERFNGAFFAKHHMLVHARFAVQNEALLSFISLFLYYEGAWASKNLLVEIVSWINLLP